MVASGQLDHVREESGSQIRSRYFRRDGLAGPIADLERVYHDDDEAVS
jgi:hypothetical protein